MLNAITKATLKEQVDAINDKHIDLINRLLQQLLMLEKTFPDPLKQVGEAKLIQAMLEKQLCASFISPSTLETSNASVYHGSPLTLKQMEEAIDEEIKQHL